MVLLQDFKMFATVIYGTVGEYNGNKAPNVFCVIPDTTHDDCFYLLNDLVLFSNI